MEESPYKIKITPNQSDFKRAKLSSKHHWMAEARHSMCNVIHVQFESLLCCPGKPKDISRNSSAAIISFTHPHREIIAATRSFGVTSWSLQDFLPTGKAVDNYSVRDTRFVYLRDKINPKLFDFQNQSHIVHFYLNYQSPNWSHENFMPSH